MTIFLEKWFDEISIDNFSFRIDDNSFGTRLTINKLQFNNFARNKTLLKKISNKSAEVNIMSALLSFSIDKLFLEKTLIETSERSINVDKLEIQDLTALDWGKWVVTNYEDWDRNLKTITTYSYSDLSNLKFDKNEIIKAAQNYNQKNFDINKDYKIFLNMVNSLGNGTTKNLVVKDLDSKNQIASINSMSLNSFKFDYIDKNKSQKFLTEFDFDISGLDININEISPEFSNYFALLGYNSIKFDFGSNYNLSRNNDLNFDLNLGITDAASLNFESSFAGLDLDQINNFNGEALLAYLSGNIRVKKIGLSLLDNSLRDKLIKFGADSSNTSIASFKSELIKQMDVYLVSSQKLDYLISTGSL